MDPEILARACVAGAVHFVFIEVLGGYHGKLPMPQGMYVRGMIDILLLGVLPEKPAERTARRAEKPAEKRPRAPRGPKKPLR